jgi:putative hydrolase of the HAD superfamily
MILTSNKTIVFDLDDTLYSERDFEKSGIEYVYNYFEIKNISLDSILNNRKDWIDQIINVANTEISIQMVLDIYRCHPPSIELYKDSKVFLDMLHSNGYEMSLITDGRSITQRNKLKALGIEYYFTDIVISEEVNSEKPAEYNFNLVANNQPPENYIYIADNPKKDFITPNKLGWTTICVLDRGQNVHKQFFNNSIEYNPHFIIKKFDEINLKMHKSSMMTT